MYSNGPVRPMPRFLTTTPTRPMGGAPTTYITPPPPQAYAQGQGTLISNSPAGPSIMANLQALGTQVWGFLKSLFTDVTAAVKRALA